MTKRIFMLLAGIVMAASAALYAEKPSLMVLPDKVWCNANGYVTKVDAQGKTRVKENYDEAFLDEKLTKAVNVINEIFTSRGFPLVDFMAKAEADDEDEGMDEMDDEEMEESAREKMNEQSKRGLADIRLELGWTVNDMGLKYNISYRLSAVDAYSNKKVATVDGESAPISKSTPMTAALKQSVNSQADDFEQKLIAHFQDLQQNGREGRMQFRVKAGSDVNYQSQFGGKTLGTIIYEWLNDNTVRHQFTERSTSTNKMNYDGVRFSMKRADGRNNNMNQFAQELQSHLRNTYGVKCTIKPATPGIASIMVTGAD